MKLNIFRRMVNGRGTMSSMKSAISATSSRKTYVANVSNATQNIAGLNIRDCSRESWLQLSPVVK